MVADRQEALDELEGGSRAVLEEKVVVSYPCLLEPSRVVSVLLVKAHDGRDFELLEDHDVLPRRPHVLVAVVGPSEGNQLRADLVNVEVGGVVEPEVPVDVEAAVVEPAHLQRALEPPKAVEERQAEVRLLVRGVTEGHEEFVSHVGEGSARLLWRPALRDDQERSEQESSVSSQSCVLLCVVDQSAIVEPLIRQLLMNVRAKLVNFGQVDRPEV
mmetsp:Transcript_39495/g.124265  ORF Transcript_39495/g.124265 Transcript_39495/m.124265 type:complete len:215 (-) Transcript_39495:1555-2199(-)